MNTFEENLAKLEKLTSDIKRNDISLEEALKDFEEGMKTACGMEKELDRIEGKIQILMTEPQPETKENRPQLDLFNATDDETGTSGTPENGVRQ
ncbi:MAG: exodeoxyribonuclease VII small subunit [Treponema sp.]|nr:exodeoxyribonuclease VII small subunit [Treponema sp.]